MEFKVYLAGPIRGLTYSGSTSWRDEVKSKFHPSIVAYSPLRGKEKLLASLPVLDERTHPVDHVLTLPQGIVARDRYDVLSSDLIFVNLIGATTVSIGTVCEIAWGYDRGKPIVLAMEEGNPHWHPFIKTLAGFIVPTLEDAVEATHQILLSE